MTRWGGLYRIIMRNNLLKSFLEDPHPSNDMLTVFAVDDDGIVQDGENGTNTEVRDIECKF